MGIEALGRKFRRLRRVQVSKREMKGLEFPALSVKATATSGCEEHPEMAVASVHPLETTGKISREVGES